MVRTNGRWHQFATEAQARLVADGYRVRHLTWAGAGWYYVTTYEQRCPRNCCYDSVIRFDTAAERAAEVAEGMRELAEELRAARAKRPAE